jgi:hypothetical protein
MPQFGVKLVVTALYSDYSIFPSVVFVCEIFTDIWFFRSNIEIQDIWENDPYYIFQVLPLEICCYWDNMFSQNTGMNPALLFLCDHIWILH